MQTDKQTKNTFPTIKRKYESSESDEDWSTTSSSNVTSKKKKSTSTQIEIPPETNKWVNSVLDRLHISWDRDMSENPSVVIDFFTPPLKETEEQLTVLEEIASFIEQAVDFDIDLSFISQLSHFGRKTMQHAHGKEHLKQIFESLKNMQAEIWEINVEGALVNIKTAICVYVIDFIESIKTYILRTAFYQKPVEISFVSILEKFCRMCNFFGSYDVDKRYEVLEGVLVVSRPDLIFTEIDEKFSFEKRTTLCVTEIKKRHYEHAANKKERPKTRTRKSESEQKLKSDSEASSKATFKTNKLMPLDIEGTAQHAGQLLLECKNSIEPLASLGIICCETQVMMTCLQVNKYYLSNMESGLEQSDRGIIHFSDMIDILKAGERNQLVRALLRLSCLQHEIT